MIGRGSVEVTRITADELAERIGVNRNTAEMILADFETARIVHQIGPGLYAMTTDARVRFGEMARLGATRVDVVARTLKPKKSSPKRTKPRRSPGPSAAALQQAQRREQARDLHARGWSIRAIARELGVAFATAQRDVTHRGEEGGMIGGDGGTDQRRSDADGLSQLRPALARPGGALAVVSRRGRRAGALLPGVRGRRVRAPRLGDRPRHPLLDLAEVVTYDYSIDNSPRDAGTSGGVATGGES